MFEVGEYESFREGENLGDIQGDAGRVDGVAEKIGVGGADMICALDDDSLRLRRRSLHKKVRMLTRWAGDIGSNIITLSK